MSTKPNLEEAISLLNDNGYGVYKHDSNEAKIITNDFHLLVFSESYKKVKSPTIDSNRLYITTIFDSEQYGAWDCTIAKEGILHPQFRNYNQPLTVKELIEKGAIVPPGFAGSYDWILMDSRYREVTPEELEELIKNAPSVYDNEHISFLLSPKKA